MAKEGRIETLRTPLSLDRVDRYITAVNITESIARGGCLATAPHVAVAISSLPYNLDTGTLTACIPTRWDSSMNSAVSSFYACTALLPKKG